MARSAKQVWIESSLGVLLILLAGLLLMEQALPGAPAAPTTAPFPRGSGELSVSFSPPLARQAGPAVPSPLDPLLSSIGAAQTSIDLALYDLDLPEVADALLAAHQRGVEVRVVAEGSNAEESPFQSLALAGVPLVADERASLMHHKFFVVDGVEVWTGSMNLTWNGVYRNDNNLVRLGNPLVALNFSDEFDEMYLEQRFGPLSRADTRYPAVELDDGSEVRVYFSPDDGALRALLRELGSARRSIDILAFSLTADPIAEALLAADARGVQVRGVVEAARAEGLGSDVGRLRAAGLDLRLDGNPANMHHKVMLIDGRTVITGSYNFSRSAEERNDENLVMIEEPELAAAYGAEFERIYREALP